MLLVTLALILGLLFIKDGIAPALFGFGLPLELGVFLLCLFLGYVLS